MIKALVARGSVDAIDLDASSLQHQRLNHINKKNMWKDALPRWIDEQARVSLTTNVSSWRLGLLEWIHLDRIYLPLLDTSFSLGAPHWLFYGGLSMDDSSR